MKVFLTALYALACIIFIGASHYYWTGKTIVQEVSAEPKVKAVVKEEKKAEKKTEKKEEKKAEATKKKDGKEGQFDNLLALTKNWPDKSIAKFEQALKSGTPFKFVIVGSTALGGETGWAAQTKAKLIESFGANAITVEIKQYDMNSTNLINAGMINELIALNGDMILLEPWILKNNGILTIEKTLENTATIIDTVKQALPDTEFILQPSFPIYKAKNYPIQVGQLQEFAVSRNIKYINHWDAWPSTDSEEIKQYLEPNQVNPNQNGHKVWADFVCDFLISK